MVYAHLVEGADQETRETFDKELNAPADGWAALERRFFATLGEAG